MKDVKRAATKMKLTLERSNWKNKIMFKSCKWDFLCNVICNWNDINSDMKSNLQCNLIEICDTSSKWNVICDRNTKQDKIFNESSNQNDRQYK